MGWCARRWPRRRSRLSDGRTRAPAGTAYRPTVGTYRIKERSAGAGRALVVPAAGRLPIPFGACDQLPPQLPAQLQGRPAVSPGARARGQDHRCDRALRDPGSGRRPDHRTGRGARGSRDDASRSGAPGQRYRIAGAGTRGTPACGASDPAQRASHRRVPLNCGAGAGAGAARQTTAIFAFANVSRTIPSLASVTGRVRSQWNLTRKPDFTASWALHSTQ